MVYKHGLKKQRSNTEKVIQTTNLFTKQGGRQAIENKTIPVCNNRGGQLVRGPDESARCAGGRRKIDWSCTSDYRWQYFGVVHQCTNEWDKETSQKSIL